MNQPQLLQIIKEYAACANYYCTELINHFQINETLLRAKVLKIIPKNGTAGSFSFNFHGRGCRFDYRQGSIDIDFGPGGRFDGFDLYRITKFIKSNKKYLIIDLDEELLAKEFLSLIELKHIAKLHGEEDDYLYYLNQKE